MVDEKACDYCGRMTWRTTGRLHVASLEASLTNFDRDIDISIENETYCDSACLCSRIQEFAFLSEQL